MREIEKQNLREETEVHLSVVRNDSTIAQKKFQKQIVCQLTHDTVSQKEKLPKPLYLESMEEGLNALRLEDRRHFLEALVLSG